MRYPLAVIVYSSCAKLQHHPSRQASTTGAVAVVGTEAACEGERLNIPVLLLLLFQCGSS